jgi:hypothetical protein
LSQINRTERTKKKKKKKKKNNKKRAGEGEDKKYASVSVKEREELTEKVSKGKKGNDSIKGGGREGTRRRRFSMTLFCCMPVWLSFPSIFSRVSMRRTRPYAEAESHSQTTTMTAAACQKRVLVVYEKGVGGGSCKGGRH